MNPFSGVLVLFATVAALAFFLLSMFGNPAIGARLVEIQDAATGCTAAYTTYVISPREPYYFRGFVKSPKDQEADAYRQIISCMCQKQENEKVRAFAEKNIMLLWCLHREGCQNSAEGAAMVVKCHPASCYRDLLFQVNSSILSDPSLHEQELYCMLLGK